MWPKEGQDTSPALRPRSTARDPPARVGAAHTWLGSCLGHLVPLVVTATQAIPAPPGEDTHLGSAFSALAGIPAWNITVPAAVAPTGPHLRIPGDGPHLGLTRPSLALIPPGTYLLLLAVLPHLGLTCCW